MLSQVLLLTSPFWVLGLAALALLGLESWAARIRRQRPQATPGLTPLERAQRQQALYLAEQRERAIANLGTHWVLHPESTFRAEDR